MALFSALLKRDGFEVRLFDTTFHNCKGLTSDMAQMSRMQVRPFDLDLSRYPLTEAKISDDIRKLIYDYNPDVICLSVLEGTWPSGIEILDAISDLDINVVVGGIFATFSPEIVLSHPAVDVVCIGEGEKAIVDLCKRLREHEDFSDVKNLWIRKASGRIIKNPIGRVFDINQLPVPDFSEFHESRFLRPMAGQVYRTIPIETNRGCPYACAFCNSPAMARLYRNSDSGTFFRKKDMGRVQRELEFLINKWKAEYIYFLSDTFLMLSDSEFDRFIDVYSGIRLPFWMQSRVETITEYRAKKLKAVGCHRMSIGLEHGNEEFRRKILKKGFTNEQMIDAAEILYSAGIPLSVNNIIGYPDETRELIFDTIELNRKIPFDTTHATSFAPFRGTELYDYSVKKGYYSPTKSIGCLFIDTPLSMPQLSKNEIEGLRRTFSLYSRLDKSYWPEIERAERNDEKGRDVFQKLVEIYRANFF